METKKYKISQQDYEILLDIEQYLFNINADANIGKKDGLAVMHIPSMKDEKAFELYIKLYAVIETLEKEGGE